MEKTNQFNIFYLFIFLLYFPIKGKNFITPSNRKPFYPYITGDGFRYLSDFAFDETVSRQDFPYKQIKNGDIIFIKTDYLHEFFCNIHPKINFSYIIISHNSDYPAPSKFKSILEEKKIIAWFAQNADYKHNKLIPIPIGLENRYCRFGNLQTIDSFTSKKITKKYLLYLNFSVNTSLKERITILHYFKNKSYCAVASKKSYHAYLEDLLQAKFVLSPKGNGPDCHRTWEALYLNSIPIVKTSPMDKLFLHLPVLIVQDWKDITEKFLITKLNEFNQIQFNSQKLWMNYWKSLINSYKLKAQKARFI